MSKPFDQPLIRPGSFARSGFTLVETMAAVVVVAILGSIASFTIFSGISVYANATTRAQLHADASVTLERLVTELRAVEQDPNDPDPAPWIKFARDYELHYGESRIIEFKLGQLLLDGDPLAHDVVAFSLDYFDNENDSLLVDDQVPSSQFDEIRRISVSLTLMRHGQTETAHTKIFIRSMRAEVGL